METPKLSGKIIVSCQMFPLNLDFLSRLIATHVDHGDPRVRRAALEALVFLVLSHVC